MAVVINGSGTVTGLAVGGLPDGTVDAGMMADNSIDSDAYVDASIDNAHLADDAVGVAELSATGTASSSTFLRGDNTWAAAGGGKVLQVVSTYHQSATQLTSSGGLHELTTSIRLSITPQSATSTLYFDFSTSFVSPDSANLHYAKVYNVTSSSTVNEPPANGSRKRVHWGIRVTPSDANDFHDLNMHTKESSSNTTARTYTIYHGTEGVAAQFLSSTLSTSGGATFPMMFKIMEVEA